MNTNAWCCTQVQARLIAIAFYITNQRLMRELPVVCAAGYRGGWFLSFIFVLFLSLSFLLLGCQKREKVEKCSMTRNTSITDLAPNRPGATPKKTSGEHELDNPKRTWVGRRGGRSYYNFSRCACAGVTYRAQSMRGWP